MSARAVTALLAVGLAVGVAVGILAGCATSRTGNGHGSGAPPARTAPPTATTTAASKAPASVTSSPASVTSSPASVTSSPATPSAVPAGITPCPQADPTATVACLHRVLSDFWSGQLNSVIGEPVVLNAEPAQVPRPCRPGIELGTAITCKPDLTLYVSRQFLALIEANFHGADLALALASVTSHEIGHVLQYTLHQPEIERHHESDATARTIEQQADCLAGVWAGQAARDGTLDAARFVADAVKLITLVSSNAEVATHGNPQQRRAAIEAGLSAGSPGACHLVTFH